MLTPTNTMHPKFVPSLTELLKSRSYFQTQLCRTSNRCTFEIKLKKKSIQYFLLSLTQIRQNTPLTISDQNLLMGQGNRRDEVKKSNREIPKAYFLRILLFQCVFYLCVQAFYNVLTLTWVFLTCDGMEDSQLYSLRIFLYIFFFFLSLFVLCVSCEVIMLRYALLTLSMVLNFFVSKTLQPI